jgi:hypothetical protein
MGGWSCTEIIGNAVGKWRQNKTRDTTTEEDKRIVLEPNWDEQTNV